MKYQDAGVNLLLKKAILTIQNLLFLHFLLCSIIFLLFLQSRIQTDSNVFELNGRAAAPSIFYSSKPRFLLGTIYIFEGATLNIYTNTCINFPCFV